MEKKQKKYRDLSEIITQINHKGTEFVPIVQLSEIALQQIFGNIEDGISEFLECYNEGESAFGVVCHYYDQRVGFTLNLEIGYKDFQLSIGDNKDLRLDKLILFDKLREWGFDLN